MEAASADYKTIFAQFSKDKKEMEGKEFVKLFKDCKLVDKKITTTDLDITFAKVKAKGARKITPDQFNEALGCIATKKGITTEELIAIIGQTGGPNFQGTKAEYNKFHDDKSQWTGVYAQGGPTNVDAGRGGGVSDLSQLANRGSADVRGVQK